MLATLANSLAVAVEVAAIAVLIAFAGRSEVNADLAERVRRLEEQLDPEPTEDTPPCSTD